MYKTHSCERADATERADTSADESDESICLECKANIVYDSARVTRNLLKTAMEQGMHSGKSPVGLAASAIYAASHLTNESVTQQCVSEVAQVSKVTIRDHYQELLDVQADV